MTLPDSHTASPTLFRDTIFVAGQWRSVASAEVIDVVDSTDEAVFGAAPAATADDATHAARAARDAFEGWAATPAGERARLIEAIAEGLDARADELADIITRQTGMPLRLSRLIQVGVPVANLTEAARLAAKQIDDVQIDNSLVVREPVGVVGCITPWNFPLHQSVAKVAFALAAGCTVVLKPSEVAPLDSFVLAEVIEQVGLPAGVFNLVTGTGPEVGESLATCSDVDMISFTGSTAAGKRVAELAAQSVKRVALELGGKSANVLLDDLDDTRFDSALEHAVQRAYPNSGQNCAALTRLLVPRRCLPRAEERLADVVAGLVVGDPFQDGVDLGPLASAAQRDRVEHYIRAGIDDGARLVAGGPGAPAGLELGFYVRPTVFSQVTPDMRIAQEEIFGPVLSVLGYESEDEAVEIANGVRYGLSGGVWAGDPARAERVARRLRTGQVDINGAQFNTRAPFGGYKESGIGREYGQYGFEEFLEIKSIQR